MSGRWPRWRCWPGWCPAGWCACAAARSTGWSGWNWPGPSTPWACWCSPRPMTGRSTSPLPSPWPCCRSPAAWSSPASWSAGFEPPGAGRARPAGVRGRGHAAVLPGRAGHARPLRPPALHRPGRGAGGAALGRRRQGRAGRAGAGHHQPGARPRHGQGGPHPPVRGVEGPRGGTRRRPSVIVLEVAGFLLVAAAGTAVVLTRDPLNQAIVASFYGLVLGIMFLVYQAPDVALSQITVGAVALPLMILLALAKVRALEGSRRRDDR